MVKKRSAEATKARRKDKSPSQLEIIEPSSGNVFADLGLPDAEELSAKSEIAIEIAHLLDRKGWTKTEIARRIDLDRPRVSDLLRGRLSGFSIDRLQAILKWVKG